MSINGSALVSSIHRESYEAISPSRPSLSQAGHTVLVAGASTGIGYSIAESFAAAAADRVIITGRRQDVLDGAAEKIKAKYPNVEVVSIINDFSDEAATHEFWKKLAHDGIFVDVLVLSAARMWLPNTILGLGFETFKDGLSINVVAPYLWTSLFHKQRESNPSRKLVSAQYPSCLGPYGLRPTRSCSTSQLLPFTQHKSLYPSLCTHSPRVLVQ
jgi:NAD(P)-dependent dehydrogenase (short-subunit alcohol dehydrogenase family)